METIEKFVTLLSPQKCSFVCQGLEMVLKCFNIVVWDIEFLTYCPASYWKGSATFQRQQLLTAAKLFENSNLVACRFPNWQRLCFDCSDGTELKDKFGRDHPKLVYLSLAPLWFHLTSYPPFALIPSNFCQQSTSFGPKVVGLVPESWDYVKSELRRIMKGCRIIHCGEE